MEQVMRSSVLSESLTRSISVGIVTFCALLAAAGPASAADAKTFPTPEAAAQALIAAAKSGNKQAILDILGSDAQDIVSSGDEVQDKEAAERFYTLAEQKMHLEQNDDGAEVMNIGPDDWPFPIPIEKKGDVWAFDTAAGKQELFDRRVGANELDTIEVCRTYVDAQRAYASQARDDSGTVKYAQRIVSSPGTHDGLYWPEAEGQPLSPLGPLIADAVHEGYGKKQGAPYHGYFYRVLTAQGKGAPGGAYNYVINRNMVGGFALIAYPATYGVTGVMTFIVNQNGVVYQKDLGLKTTAIAQGITSFDPNSSWQKVQ
jgi:hypothetical protein